MSSKYKTHKTADQALCKVATIRYSQGCGAMRIGRYRWMCWLLVTTLGLTSEQEKDQDLPILESSHVVLSYSEQGVTKYRLSTEKVLHYENGDRVYPEGMRITFYAPNKEITLTGHADYARFFAHYNVYMLKGDVEIKNLHDKKQLNTEELYWNTGQATVYTDKFVRIDIDKEGQLTGMGLMAEQDLSYYVIHKLQGQLHVIPD